MVNFYTNIAWSCATDTYRGVAKFNGMNWTTYTTAQGLIHNEINDIAIDAQGNVWACSRPLFIEGPGGVNKFDGTGWTSYNTSDGLASPYVSSVEIDSKGNKWFGTTKGVNKFDDVTWTTYDSSDGLSSNYIYAIAEDNNQALWFATGNGLSIYDGTAWQTFTTKDGLSSKTVRSIMIDSEGNTWAGTDGGVTMIRANTITGVEDMQRQIPLSFRLDQNYPNPFNPTTTIRYEIPHAGQLSLRIYNILGQEVKTLVNGQFPSGSHEVQWDGSDNYASMVSSGIYLYRLETGSGVVQTKKMIFIK